MGNMTKLGAMVIGDSIAVPVVTPISDRYIIANGSRYRKGW